MSLSEDRRMHWGTGRVYHALLASFFLLIALQAFADPTGGLFVRLGWACLMVTCIVAGASTRRLLVVGLTLGIPAVGLLFVPGQASSIAAGSLSIATLVFICAVILRRIFNHPDVSMATVSASLVVYMALGVVWSQAYSMVERLVPGSFTGLTGTDAVLVQRDLFYYSYVTLATLGYGDINPVSPVARSLAITEAIVGQLYLVVLVAGLVGMRLAVRQSRSVR